MVERTHGAVLLELHLEALGRPQKAVAEELGTSGSAIHYWLRGGQRPRPKTRARIAEWSNGSIPEDSWTTLAERKKAGLPDQAVRGKAA